MALLDPPRPAAARAPSAALRLTVAGTAWSLPMDSVRAIAEAGGDTAPPTPLPLAGSPVEGIAAVEGRPVLQIDTARALARVFAGAPDAPPGAGRVLVVVATEAGELALRVEDARWAGETDAPALELDALLPWAGGLVPVVAPPPPARKTVATLPLLRVRHGGEEVALRIDRLDRIARPDALIPVPESRDSLVSLNGALLTARPLASGIAGESPYALVLRGDEPGERAALLVDRAPGVERCPLDDLAALRHSDGVASLWWRRAVGLPLRVIDPGPLFGWSAHPGEGSAGNAVEGPGRAPARPESLLVEIAGHAVAFPLALVAEVEEPASSGDSVRLRLAGARRALPVDRVRPLEAPAEAEDTAGWQSLTALPPSVAPLFDAARWDGAVLRWQLRASADSLRRIPGNRVAWPAKRALAAARRVWGDGLPGPAGSSPPSRRTESTLPVTARS